jgi:hypothetical protein
MADTTTTPNMNLPVPTPSEAPGPDWASSVVTDMYAIDSHDHSSGQGVPVTPAGLSINADLPFGNNNATALKSARFTAQSGPLAGGSDLGCAYVSGVDLYYNDVNGNQIRITASGAVNGSTGTITGLPSGTASASFSAGTFTFQSATSTGATISCGPVAIGSTTASTKQTTIASNASQASNISLVLPTAAPTNGSALTSDGSGNLSWTGSTGSGGIVRSSGASVDSVNIDTATFSGSIGGVITGGTYTPTIVASVGTATVLGVWFYQRINNVVSVSGWTTIGLAANFSSFTATLPINPTNNFANDYDLSGTTGSNSGGVSSATNIGNAVTASVGAKKALVYLSYSASPGAPGTAAINFMYSCA